MSAVYIKFIVRHTMFSEKMLTTNRKRGTSFRNTAKRRSVRRGRPLLS